jgi:hypothetical protein
MSDKLRLKATDAEDLGVISAVLQDARIPLAEMAFVKDEGRFMAAFVRYRRERQPDPRSCEGLTETMSVLAFDGIDEVKYKGVDTTRPDVPLSLLTIATRPGKNHLIHIELVFEGDAEISLRTDAIKVRLDDFGDARPCQSTPCDHEKSILPGWTESYDAQT